jgi:hypothetical protein
VPAYAYNPSPRSFPSPSPNPSPSPRPGLSATARQQAEARKQLHGVQEIKSIMEMNETARFEQGRYEFVKEVGQGQQKVVEKYYVPEQFRAHFEQYMRRRDG